MDKWKGDNRWRQHYVERERWNFAVKQSRANERSSLIALFACSALCAEVEMSCLAASVSGLHPYSSKNMGAFCY